jgi:hypothetical protein
VWSLVRGGADVQDFNLSHHVAELQESLAMGEREG